MVKIWDKVESINGISAEFLLSTRDDLRNASEVILIGDESGNITNIEFPHTLKSILQCDSSLSALEVGQLYEKFMLSQSNKPAFDEYVESEVQMKIGSNYQVMQDMVSLLEDSNVI